MFLFLTFYFIYFIIIIQIVRFAWWWFLCLSGSLYSRICTLLAGHFHSYANVWYGRVRREPKRSWRKAYKSSKWMKKKQSEMMQTTTTTTALILSLLHSLRKWKKNMKKKMPKTGWSAIFHKRHFVFLSSSHCCLVLVCVRVCFPCALFCIIIFISVIVVIVRRRWSFHRHFESIAFYWDVKWTAFWSQHTTATFIFSFQSCLMILTTVFRSNHRTHHLTENRCFHHLELTNVLGFHVKRESNDLRVDSVTTARVNRFVCPFIYHGAMFVVINETK